MIRRRRPLRRPGLKPRRLRPLPPPIDGPARRGVLPPRVRRALAEANRLMEAGRFAEAAASFGTLATKAAEHGFSIRAAELTLRAARAHFAAGHVADAVDEAQEALQLFVQGGRPERVPPVLAKMAEALRQKGHAAEAEQLEQAAEQLLGEQGLSMEEAQRRMPQAVEKRGSLPASCDGCAAPLVPDEVEWHDAHTAECPYCGTIAKAT